MTAPTPRSHKTLGDVVHEHAGKEYGGTTDGMELLGVRGSEHNACANLYLAAISIIREQDTAILAARQEIAGLRERVLEECAKICDDHQMAYAAAMSIRALKGG